MANVTEELVKICGDLPEEQVGWLLKYARALQEDDFGSDGDKEWDRIVNDPQPRPKLEKFIEEAKAEGGAEPLDYEKL